MIPYNRPTLAGRELEFIAQAIENRQFCGDHEFTKKCSAWLLAHLGRRSLLTTSCTHALEMAASLLGLAPGDEVIMPSFTFVSTANAFVMRGAKIRFVDIRPDTLNLDERLIEAAINERTKAIVPVHYAGVACEMDYIMELAQAHGLAVVEDAAQALMCSYKGRPLGTIGDFGCFSFHETKNYQCGEGGALVLGRPELIEKAEIIREKGTNRSQFFRGQVDKYTWMDWGSSYLMSDLNAAFLYAQLLESQSILEDRLASWKRYHQNLEALENKGHIERPKVPEEVQHNGHLYFIKVRDIEERSRLLDFFKSQQIGAVFHYVPLHSAPAGIRFGEFNGEDQYTTKESERLLRLPLFTQIKAEEIDIVCQLLTDFFRSDS
ncbi:MAG: dTDP-4-amino-4,6-dideoxygalactose transaminase [bacterium]|nr:dTDP-4-amino-4,6-dideoxygalactose transaminase [bacterium]